MIRICYTLAFVVSLATAIMAETPLPRLQGKVVLKAEHSPYVMENNAVLGALDTLVVQPGVTLKVKGYSRLLLRGVVEIRGTQKRPVRFVAYDTSDSWIGLHFATGERPFVVEHLIVENAFRNTVSSSVGAFVSSHFVNNYYGLWVESSPSLLIGKSNFARNRYALSVGSGSVKLMGSSLKSNVYGIFIEKGAHLEGDLAQASDNAEADVRDETSEIAGNKAKLSRSLWRKVEAAF